MLAHKMKMVVATGIAVMVSMAAVGNAQSTPAHAAPASSSADTPAWKEYKKFLENYYFLDKQKSGQISCHISSPTMQGMIDHLQQKSGNRLTIDANLSGFSVTYDRRWGASFSPLHIHSKYNFSLATTKPADVEQFKTWQKWAETTLNNAILAQEKGIAEHLMEMNMISLNPTEKKNLSLTKNGDATVILYDVDENGYIRVIYSGATRQETDSSPTFNMTSTSDYQPLNGKLALVHRVIKSTVGSRKVDRTFSINYQDLGSTFFPAQILEDIAAPKGTEQSVVHVEYDFKDCKTSDLTSIEALHRAADQGDAEAQYKLGKAYLKGIDVEKDYKQAVVWWRKSAEQGNAEAQNILGVAYHGGQGVEKDDKEAINWWRKSADQGNAGGQMLLGSAYAYGHGVGRNYKETYKWYRKAADQGDAKAQLVMRNVYKAAGILAIGLLILFLSIVFVVRMRRKSKRSE